VLVTNRLLPLFVHSYTNQFSSMLPIFCTSYRCLLFFLSTRSWTIQSYYLLRDITGKENDRAEIFHGEPAAKSKNGGGLTARSRRGPHICFCAGLRTYAKCGVLPQVVYGTILLRVHTRQLDVSRLTSAFVCFSSCHGNPRIYNMDLSSPTPKTPKY
jgi:hypothetical protein